MASALAANERAGQTVERSPWRFGYKYGRLEQVHIPNQAAHDFREFVTENQYQFIRGLASPSVPQFC